jgi:hypothetical protein
LTPTIIACKSHSKLAARQLKFNPQQDWPFAQPVDYPCLAIV